jgi:hypothetical protein
MPERETIIRSPTADQEWDICTADPRTICCLIRQGYALDSDCQLSHPFIQVKIPFEKLRITKRDGGRFPGRPLT